MNKPSSHQSEEESYSDSNPSQYEPSLFSGNQPIYPYPYPNGIGPFTTIVGAAIVPAIIPLNQDSAKFPYAETSEPIGKPFEPPAKKQSHNRQKGGSSKQPMKESDWHSNGPTHSSNSYYSSNKAQVRKEKPGSPVYFEFLNTHTSSQNYPNLPSINDGNPYQHTQPNRQFNQFNGQHSYGTPNQGFGFNKQFIGQNAFANAPFNGYINPPFGFNANFPIP